MLVLVAGIVCALALGSLPAMPAADAGDAGVDAYVIGPDDALNVLVEQHPEWTGEFVVRPDGNIVIPGIGEFKVSGMTKAKAEGSLRQNLERYINNPRVTVEIVKYASQVIFVLGAVSRPGKYSTEGKNLTLRDAVILAGLPTTYAAPDRVYVITPTPVGRPRQQVINLDRILNRGELKRNIPLKPGDIVYVPLSILGRISELFGVILSPLSNAVNLRAVVAQ
jgi:polysaccharide export outer membrane protein